MQPIITKLHGPTNNKPSRISARCDAGRIMVSRGTIPDSVDRGINADPCHEYVALALRDKLGWSGRLVGAELKPGVWVWVFDRAGDELLHTAAGHLFELHQRDRAECTECPAMETIRGIENLTGQPTMGPLYVSSQRFALDSTLASGSLYRARVKPYSLTYEIHRAQEGN